ncbi:MAG: acylneuraminate cytidylyltransferase family protein [Gemmatimonadota bacterium]|nr:acylneuraminate cytidylyltransferase family protein [Gemmatimonadota bacterium]
MSSAASRRALGIVPARRGSKGIPGKNVQDLGGRPLVQHTLDAAQGAKGLTWILVTSDDPGVLKLAGAAGLNILERPDRLATDDASMSDVVSHALSWAEQNLGAVDDLVLLQPTSPFRTAADVDEALAAYAASSRESLISVCDVTQHPAECLLLDDRGQPHPVEITPDATGNGRQRYPRCYFIDGGIYITSVERFRRTGTFADESSALHEIPRSHGLDIDHPFDLAVARALTAYAKTAPEVFTL